MKNNFRNVVTGYLALKDSEEDPEDILDALFEYNQNEHSNNYINLLFFKDIVNGIWNGTSTIEQAVFQVIYAVDLELALHGLLISPSAKTTDKFKKLTQQLSSVETSKDLETILQLLHDDTTWIPIQKEYRKHYVFLITNLLTLVYFDTSFDDVSDIGRIIKAVS